MPQPAIRVENLSKLCRIGERQARYRTLRESLTDLAAAPFRRWRAKSVEQRAKSHGDISDRSDSQLSALSSQLGASASPLSALSSPLSQGSDFSNQQSRVLPSLNPQPSALPHVAYHQVEVGAPNRVAQALEAVADHSPRPHGSKTRFQDRADSMTVPYSRQVSPPVPRAANV